MATSDAMPRRPRLFHRAVPCLLLCAAWLVVFDALHRLSFVQGVALHGTRAAQRQVAQRFSQKGQQARGELNADGKVEARRLTSSIKKAYSAVKLIEVLDGAVDGPIFNFFHASAAYTQLERLKRKRDLKQRHWDSPVLRRLHAQVEDMILKHQLNAQASANVLWSIARLANQLSIPTQLLAALVKSVPTKVRGMKPQELSNCMWASARLKDVAPVVLEIVPALVAQIPKRAKDMGAQELSNCLWASAHLKDVAPHALEAVPAIVTQIPCKAQGMIPQHLSNCLWASGQLKDLAPDVLEAVPAIVAQIPDKAPDMIPQHLSNCLFAAAQLKGETPKVLEIVPAMVGKIPLKLQNMTPQEMSNSLEALVLLQDSVPEVKGFLAAGGRVDDILRSAAKRLNILLPQLKGKDFSFTVPVVIWACAKGGVYDGELLGSVARRLSSRTKLSALPDFGVCALSWSYQVLDTDDEFEDFKRLLRSETEKRGFSEAVVQSCQFGRSEWNYR